MENNLKTEKKKAATSTLAEAGGALTAEKGATSFAGTQIPLITNASDGGFIGDRIKVESPKGYLIEIYTMLKGKGYMWVKGGFLKKEATADGPNFYGPKTERDFFAFIGMPWTEPELREFGSVYPKDAPDNPACVTEDELSAWVNTSRWVDTKCGGEAHQYTTRNVQKDDEMFCRVLNSIYGWGYDGEYLGRSWRYLDFDGMRYFANNYRIAETQLINRKNFWPGHSVRPWKRNPVKLRPLTMRGAR
jgi:hypothetical protein